MSWFSNIATSAYVNNGLPVLLSDLLTNYPAGSIYEGCYARVTDLYNNGVPVTGGINEIVRCRFDATNNSFRWIPQRDSYNGSFAVATGSMSLIPLVTPPTVRLTGTLLGNLTVTPTLTNAYIGQQFTVIQNSTLGLFSATITGLLGSNLTLLGNNSQVLEYFPTGWNKASS